MSTLIRYEDTYGMGDISIKSKMCKIMSEFVPRERITEFVPVGSDFLQIGMNANIMFRLKEAEIYGIMSYNIHDIVFVLDLDNWSGDKTKILQVGEFEQRVKKFSDGLSNKTHVNLHFVPIMYAAETFYLYFLYKCTRNPCDIVSVFNTNEVHGALVAAYLHKKKVKDAKNIRSYLSNINVIELLQNELNKGRYGNTDTLKWLLEENDWLKYTYSTEEMIDYLNVANEYFESRKVDGENLVKALGDQFDCNSEHSVKAFIARHSRVE